jgi:hypothetical protein
VTPKRHGIISELFISVPSDTNGAFRYMEIMEYNTFLKRKATK